MSICVTITNDQKPDQDFALPLEVRFGDGSSIGPNNEKKVILKPGESHAFGCGDLTHLIVDHVRPETAPKSGQ